MSFFRRFPYSNAHDLNLDWVLKQVKEMAAKFDIRPMLRNLLTDQVNIKSTDGQAYVYVDSDETPQTGVIIDDNGVSIGGPMTVWGDAGVNGELGVGGDIYGYDAFMSGTVHGTHVVAYGTDKYPRFIFNLQDESKPAGWLLMNTDTRGMSFRVYMADGVHYDSFAMPVPSDLSRTTDIGYQVLTSKSPVTMDQGGTGATGKVALTITPGSSSITIGHNLSYMWGKLVCLCFYATTTSNLSNGDTLATISGTGYGFTADTVDIPLIKVSSSGTNGWGKIYSTGQAVRIGGSLSSGDYIINATYMIE